MWGVDSRRGVFLVSLTTTRVLIINVDRRHSIHHGGVTICLPRVVEDQWRRKSIGSRTRECSMLCCESKAF
jgi:hypothetical protein